MLNIEKFYDAVPEVSVIQTNVGFPTVTDGTAILRLQSWKERQRHQEDIARELQPKFPRGQVCAPF